MKDNDYILTNLDNVDPSPIPVRICECGCGYAFQPKRKDQIYLNRKHTDHGYHFNVRKPKLKNQKIIEKILRKSDRACAKYFTSRDSKEAIFILEALTTDGLDLRYSVGQDLIEGKKYYYLYNYIFQLFKEDGIKKIKIRKK
ncbi:MAG: hypothetical protein COA33_000695 [Fluviicola sp.]|nr:hypothetical protein [Fluviicola sp.]